MKLVFIKPNMIVGTPCDSIEPLVFAILSALTPPEIDVSLFDDRCERIPYDLPTDLAAITVETFTARRAYEIAGEYRKRGVPVVLGGFHPTLCPEEAAQYTDSIVTGDAGSVWKNMLEDSAIGNLKERYHTLDSNPQAGGIIRTGRLGNLYRK